MYRFLSTNVETLKERGLEAKTNEVTLVALDEDIEKGNDSPIIYAFRNGRIYNPYDDFKPNTPRGHKLEEGSQVVADYWDQLPSAKFKYKQLLKAEQEYKKSGENKGEHVKALEDKQKEIEKQAKKILEIEKQLEEIRKNGGKQAEIRHPEFDTIVEILKEKVAVYAYGNAGTGKSKLAEQIADHLGLKFYPASTITQEFKLTGYKDAGGLYHDTNFYKAMKHGGLFFLDEMDSCASEVLVGLNGALANGYFDFPNGTIWKHDDFRVMSAGNTIGRGADDGFTGRQALDISTLDRFMAVEIEYSPEIDQAVARGDQELVDFAHAMRKASEQSEILILMSYRAIDNIVKFKDKFDLTKLMKMSVIKGMSKEDMNMLARNMSLTSSNKYYKAFKNAI